MMKRWEMTAPGRRNLELVSRPIPQPGPGEILVEVAAVALNYRDTLVIEHGLPVPLPQPFSPASDMAGTVAAAGPGADRFKAGDRVISVFNPGWIDGRPSGSGRALSHDVLGGALQGVLASHVVMPQGWVVAAPASLDDAEAATLPCAGLTAWFALIDQGALRAGQTVVVQGTGGVALFGIQIAAAHGAEVIVTSGDATKLNRAVALGARHGIDRRAHDWVAEVHRLTGDRGADHVLEIAGGPHLGRALDAAAMGGIVSLIGVIEGFDISASALPMFLKKLRVQGIGVGPVRALEDLVRAVDHLGLKPVIDRRYALADLPAALDHLAAGPFGKVVVTAC